ncbi:PEP-CTERM sorting domain-containing protein [Desulfopila aestuarii]|nr:PEP-CTERM sorting domain-containing protein [Desulfopila aestuarii]
MKKSMKTAAVTLFAGCLVMLGSNAFATLASVFGPGTGWTQFQEGGTSEDVTSWEVTPGVGGQDFDAEYLLYKLEGSILNLGLQTGFDLLDGHVHYPSKNYYAGDLALSFDSDNTQYEYAVDFGLFTADYQSDTVDAGSGDGKDEQGLYKVKTWNKDIYYDGTSGRHDSSPFAMDDKYFGLELKYSNVGEYTDNSNVKSYYRIVAFDLVDVLGEEWNTEFLTIDAHWTMSCGNDEINGRIEIDPVPEPATMLLFGTGLVGLTSVLRRRKK